MLYNNGDLRPFFDGSSSGADTFNTNINDGQWHHVVVMNNGAGTTSLFVDGTAAGTDSESLHKLDLARQMTIGSEWDGTGGHFDGKIDDFAVWGRTLDTTEIQTIYNAGLSGQTFVGAPVLANTSFEPEDGFTGYAAGSHSALGAVVDVDGVQWATINDARIWNRTDIPPDGIQALVMGINATDSSCLVSIPGDDHGVGIVTFDYASFSSSTNADVSLSYRVDGGSWTEVWNIHMTGLNPHYDDKPWPTVVVPVNVAGDVDLRFRAVGTKGFKIDNVIVYDKPAGTQTSNPPAFTVDPIILSDAVEGLSYTDTLAGLAEDPDDEMLTYAKVGGPAWLNVAPDGTLSGTPTDSDVGQNGFIVRAVDPLAQEDTAVLYVTVLNTYGGHWGLDDLSAFATQWLAADCVDIPACGGADLTGDQDVTLTDYAVLSSNWDSRTISGLVADWQMDDAAGTIVRDNYKDLDATLSGTDETGCWDVGYSGNALLLDGTDDYAVITDYCGVLGTAARTVSARIQTSQPTEGTIVSWGQAGYPWGGQWSILVSGGKLKVNVGFGYATGTTVINDGQWHHIAVVLPEVATPTSQDIQLYVDGQPETLSAYNNVDIDTRCGAVPVDAAIGRDAYSQTHYFNGKIDNLRIYDTALEAVEINEL